MPSLVLGAGGFLGLNLVDALHDAGVSFVCGTRRRAPRVALRRRGVQTTFTDLDAPESLERAMQGHDVVYHLAGHYPALAIDREATLAVGRRHMAAVLDAAAAAGVGRLVYLSSTATVAPAAGRPSTESDTWPGPPGIGVYHDLKWHMEQQALAERRLEVVVAVPGGCLGPWDQRIGTSALLVGLARGMPVRVPDGTVNLVDARDVAWATVRLGTMSAVPPRVLLVGHDRRLAVLLRRLARRYGVAMPTLLAADEAIALADAEESAAAAQGGRPRASREIVDLILHGTDVDASLSRTALGVRYRALDTTLDDYDHWARARRILPRNQELSP